MKTTKNIAILFLFAALLAACKKKEADQPASPGITSINVTDYCARRVTVEGTNFNPDISKDSIFFGSVKGIINSATPTLISATFPQGNITGNITVYSNGISTSSPFTFTVLPPIITSFSPSAARPGDTVTITGQNFNSNINFDSVYFNNIPAKIVTAGINQLTVIVPQGSASGVIKVTSNCMSVNSSLSFTSYSQGIVYGGGNTGETYAIDIATGKVIWKVATNAKFLSSPTYENGVLFIGSSDVNNLANNYMYGLDPLTGVQKWKYNAGPWDCIPLVNDGVLYAGSFEKKLYAFKSSTGEKLWSFTAGSYFSSGGPSYYNGNVYCRNDDGYFYCLDAGTGTLKWRALIYPGGNAAVANGMIYVTGASMLYALDPTTGSTIWSKNISLISSPSPTVVNGVLYIGSELGGMYAMNPSNGNIIWQAQNNAIANAVFVTDNILYFHSTNGTIGAVNALNGATLWSKYFPGSGLIGASPVVANGVLFFGDDAGRLHALKATTGDEIWSVNTGGIQMISDPLVVDQNGKAFYSGESGNQN